jgi:hypothetical protein
MSLKSESENNPAKNLGKDDTEIELQLGDIIQITNPSNEINSNVRQLIDTMEHPIQLLDKIKNF